MRDVYANKAANLWATDLSSLLIYRIGFRLGKVLNNPKRSLHSNNLYSQRHERITQMSRAKHSGGSGLYVHLNVLTFLVNYLTPLSRIFSHRNIFTYILNERCREYWRWEDILLKNGKLLSLYWKQKEKILSIRARICSWRLIFCSLTKSASLICIS